MFNDITEIAPAGAVHMCFPLVNFLPGDLFKATPLVKFVKTLDEYMNDLIEMNKTNIVSLFLKEIREKQEKGIPTYLSEYGLGKVIIDLLIAGTETTARTLTHFSTIMVQHPEIQSKVHEEIDEIIGHERNPRIADRPKMVYLNTTFMETLWLAHAVRLGVLHLCTEVTTVRG